ncbi:MAG TPA: hypothetical protein VEB68_01210 [Croceibacterium sp.]|nr:hypothetical protein [Croceibacterium sp.]
MSGGRVLGAMAPALLASCAAAGTAPSPPEWEAIAFEVNSWGRPVVAWTVRADGSGEWAETVGERDAPVGPFRVEHHTIAAGSTGFRELAAVLAELPDPAPASDDCELFATDMPYGTLRLTRAATTREIAFNEGCRDPAYRAFIATLKRADALVESWGKAAPVSRSEEFPRGR